MALSLSNFWPPLLGTKTDRDSAQLKDAINSGKAIIITTLQKFPVIYKDILGGQNNFAVIVDEAHSSQTGEAAKKLKKALADTESILEELVLTQKSVEGKLERVDLTQEGKDHAKETANLYERI